MAAALKLQEQPSEDPGLRLLFAAMMPAVRLAVAGGVPLDAARDMLVGALMAESEQRRSGLPELAAVLGRSTRQIRTLLRTGARGFEPRGENLVDRAERMLAEPMSLAELTRRMPRYYAFDAAALAVNALVREGRVSVTQPRIGPAVYEAVGQPRPLKAPVDRLKRRGRFARHLRAVAGVFSGPDRTFETAQVRFRPEDAQRMHDAVVAFVESQVAALEAQAEGDDSAVACSVYLGGSVEASAASGSFAAQAAV
jgi:hypothetical protein